MQHDQNPANAYLRTKVMSARPEQLRLMLIEGAIRFARQGREGLASKNYELSYAGITQCRNIVVELMSGLRDDIDPELCTNVRALYTFLFRELTEASLEKSTERVDKVIELLEYERQTWELLIQKLNDGETVGAGKDEGGSLSVQA